MLSAHLEKLAAFAAVVDAGSVSAAARGLHISQPALSRALQAIERDLGTPILVRGRQGVALTEAGRVLLAATKGMLDLVHRAETSIQRSVETHVAHLTLGTKEPFSIHLWPRYLSWLATRPGVASTLETARSLRLTIDKSNRRLWDDLKAARSDLVLLAEPPAEAGIRSIRLFTSAIGLYAGKGSPNDDALLCYGDAVVKHGVRLGACLREVKLARRVVDVQSFDAAREMAARGLGVSLLPDWIARDDVERGRLRELPLGILGAAIKFPRSGVYLCSVTPNDSSRAVSALNASLRSFCQTEFAL